MNVSVKRYPASTKTQADIVRERATEHDLWNALRKGSREALDQLFDQYARHLFAYGKKITADHGLISDCIQDLFIELWLKRDILVAEIKSVRFYLIKSVRRRIVRRLSTDRRVIGMPIPEGYTATDHANIESKIIDGQTSGELAHCVKNSLSVLSDGQREAIHLKFYENLSYDEIASIMNTNVKAVYNLISKSIISLRKALQKHPAFENS